MSATILLAGENVRMARIVARAEALGITPVAVADVEACAVTEHARVCDADGIMAMSECAAHACAQASRELGLRGPSPEAVCGMLDKSLLHEALLGTMVEHPHFAVAATVDAAIAAARRLRPPWVVKPAIGDRNRGVSFIAHVEDLPLGYQRAGNQSEDARVLIEEYAQGDEFVLDGIVRGGVLHTLCISLRMRPAPPMLHDLGMLAPVAEPIATMVNEFGRRTVDALGYSEGPVRIELIHTGDEMHVIETSPCVCGGRFETDLAWTGHGGGLIESAMRACIGRDLPEPAPEPPVAALLWIAARSGVVEGVRGLDEARAVAGVDEVEVHARTGDWIGHSMVRRTHDRIGHVLAHGATAEAAMAAAKAALERCEIVTRSTISSS